ncbi:MAG: Nramp family divalent metal transporter [Rhodopirellula sp.]|nr:Nramp family divalent metal transporter [Rhodopirellula sp.]
MPSSDETDTSRIRNAPRGFVGTLAALGPGLVVIGSVMGSGELINTPHQAATFGFVLLWAVILSCVIKYFLQIEIGRFTLAHQCTPFEAFSTLPFPKFRNTSWIGLAYMAVSLPTSLAFAGMIGATAGMLHSLLPLSVDVETSNTIWIWLLAVLTWGILWRGVYAEMEKLIMVLVLGFSVSVVIGMFLIQGTEFHISMSDLAKGMTFSLGEESRLAAFAVISLMGALGATANELFMYPYWILEKGYADFTGPPESTGWQERTRGWIRIIQIDVGLATFLTTIITAAYFLMGAAVLHRQGIEVSGTGVVDELSRMFTDSYGPWSRELFLLGAFCTLFSTLVVGVAAFARMWGDMFVCLGTIAKDDSRRILRCHRIAEASYMIMIPVIAIYGESVSKSLFGTDKIGPATLVIAGQYVSGLFCTPLLIFAICWLAFRTDKRVRMGRMSAICLIVSVIAITACILISTLTNLLG